MRIAGLCHCCCCCCPILLLLVMWCATLAVCSHTLHCNTTVAAVRRRGDSETADRLDMYCGHCEQHHDCQLHLCLHAHSTFSLLEGVCECRPGWSGHRCHKPQCVHGTLEQSRCKCEPRWTGEHCDGCITTAIRSPDRQHCDCPALYSGPQCIVPECLNGSLDESGRVCHCNGGWVGVHCQLAYCEHGTWRNGECRCHSSDWRGDRCEQLACAHGHNAHDLRCVCPAGYYGRMCQWRQINWYLLLLTALGALLSLLATTVLVCYCCRLCCCRPSASASHRSPSASHFHRRHSQTSAEQAADEEFEVTKFTTTNQNNGGISQSMKHQVAADNHHPECCAALTSDYDGEVSSAAGTMDDRTISSGSLQNRHTPSAATQQSLTLDRSLCTCGQHTNEQVIML